MVAKASLPCEKAGDIAKIQEQISDLCHIIKDNGQPGLATTTTKLTVVVNQLSEDVNALRTVVSGFERYIAGEDAKTKSRQWMASVLPSIFAVMLSTVIMLYGTGVMKKESKELKDNIENSK